MSPFEIIMLVCFGAAWPFSIAKSWRTREHAGKSLAFLCVIFVGYVSGTVNKFVGHHYDHVVYLYMLNGLMVAGDIAVHLRNQRLASAG
jgi:hypothetical protein